MDNQYFKRKLLAQSIRALIYDIDEEMKKSYFSRIMGSMNLKAHRIEILDDENLSLVFVEVRDPDCLFFLDIDLETKTFTIKDLPDDEENIFSLTNFVSSIRLVASGKPRKTSAELDFELEQIEEWSEDENIGITSTTSDIPPKTNSNPVVTLDDIANKYFDDKFDLLSEGENFDGEDNNNNDMDDEDAGDFEDGIDDIFEMELEEIDNAQCTLRLKVREHLRFYPHVEINDMLDGKPVSKEEEWDYIEQEVQMEGRNFENLDQHFTPFEVPITLFGDHFTLCFSPFKITVRQANTILNIPAATEYHIVLNALLEFLSDEAKRLMGE